MEVPRVCLKTYGDRAFSVAASKLWNDVCLEITSSVSVTVFKSHLKNSSFKNLDNHLEVEEDEEHEEQDDDDDDYRLTSPQKLSPLQGLLYPHRCTLPSVHVDFPLGSGRPSPQW